MSNVTVTIYTDPGCPFGFNAQRQELQLAWHYGHDGRHPRFPHPPSSRATRAAS